MKQAHRAYLRARDKVLETQGQIPDGYHPQDLQEGEDPPPQVEAHRKAEEALRAAEEAVAADLQAAWDRNQQAVVATKEALAAALTQLARIETECGTAAYRRDPIYPVLNEAERQLITTAREVVVAARDALIEAQDRFKNGVTAEQLAEVSS